MVDCHPEETLSTEAEPRLTMLFERWRSTMSSRKECNIYFIISNVPISYTTSILCYWITLRTVWHFHWTSPVAMTLLRMPRRPPLVSQFEPYAHIFAHVTFFLNVTLPSIALVKTVWHSKNVTRSIDQSDYRKLTWGIIILDTWKCRFTNFHKTFRDSLMNQKIISDLNTGILTTSCCMVKSMKK